MAITKVTASPPAENTDPWYSARTTLDNQLKATANAAATLADELEATLDPAGTPATMTQAEAQNSASTAARLVTGQRLSQAVAAFQTIKGILDYNQTPPSAGIWLRRPAP